MFKSGDIIYGRKKSLAIHPIVYLGEFDGDYFLGGMLTHSSGSNNIALIPNHFVRFDSGGIEFPFQFDNTFLVGKKLLKRNEWAPFTKVGRLTKEGIVFVIGLIGNQDPQLWEEYLKE